MLSDYSSYFVGVILKGASSDLFLNGSYGYVVLGDLLFVLFYLIFLIEV